MQTPTSLIEAVRRTLRIMQQGKDPNSIASKWNTTKHAYSGRHNTITKVTDTEPFKPLCNVCKLEIVQKLSFVSVSRLDFDFNEETWCPLPCCVLQHSSSASRWRHRNMRTSETQPPWRASNSSFLTFPQAKPCRPRRGGGCSKSLKSTTLWSSSSISLARSETYRWRVTVWLPRCTSLSQFEWYGPYAEEG